MEIHIDIELYRFMSHAGHSAVSKEERRDSEEPCGERPPATGRRQQGEFPSPHYQTLCTSLPQTFCPVYTLIMLYLPPPLFTL